MNAAAPDHVYLAVLGAAVLHASWNTLLKSSGDRIYSLAFQNLTMAAAGGLLLLSVAPFPAAASWPYIAASSAILFFYQYFLLKTYDHGDLSRGYPIARGSAPALVALAGLLLGDDILSLEGYLGLGLISLGIMSLIFSKRFSGGVSIWHRDFWDRGLRFALLTGLMIAGYSVIDSRGVHLAGTAIGYTALLFLTADALFFFYALALRRAIPPEGLGPSLRRGFLGGILATIGYMIVVWAYSQTSAAEIVALRETSVVFGALFGALLLKEGFGRQRVLSAVLVLAGILVLRLLG